MTAPAEAPTSKITLAEIAELAAVGRSAVSNWRRRFNDFPQPVAGSTSNPLFDQQAVEEWLRQTDRYVGNTRPERQIWTAVEEVRGVMGVEAAVEAISAFLAYRVLTHSVASGDGLVMEDGTQSADAWGKLSQFPHEDMLDQLVDEVADLERADPRLKDVLVPSLAGLPVEAAVLLVTVGSRPHVEGPKILEGLLSSLRRNTGRGTLEWSTPERLTDLLLDLAQPLRGRLYDPAAGAAGLLVRAQQAESSLRVFGQELNERAWRLANQRLIVHRSHGEVARGNTLLHDARPDLLAETILLDPPYGMKNWGAERVGPDPRWRFGPPTSTADMAWLQHAVAHLAPGGRAYVVLPASSLFRSGPEARVRHELIRQGAIDAILALPAGLHPGAPISLAVWVLCPPGKPSQPGQVLMVDATGQDTAGSATDEAVTEQYRQWREHGEITKSSSARAVSVMELLAVDATLVPVRWITSEPTLDSRREVLRDLTARVERLGAVSAEMPRRAAVIQLNRVIEAAGEPHRVSIGRLVADKQVTVVRGPRIGRDDLGSTGVPVITAADVRAGIPPSRQRQKVDPQRLDKEPELSQVGDVAVVTEGSSIRAAVDAEGGAIFGSMVIGIRVRPEHIDPRYLAACLQSEWNTRFSVGSAMPRAHIKDLEIPLLPLADQLVVANLLDQAAKAARAGAEAARLAEDLRTQIVDGIAAGAVQIQGSRVPGTSE